MAIKRRRRVAVTTFELRQSTTVPAKYRGIAAKLRATQSLQLRRVGLVAHAHYQSSVIRRVKLSCKRSSLESFYYIYGMVRK